LIVVESSGNAELSAIEPDNPWAKPITSSPALELATLMASRSEQVVPQTRLLKSVSVVTNSVGVSAACKRDST
jgi:hypothetical protein